MAPRPGTYQAAFTSGELDLRVQGRTDIKQFYMGASRMQRVQPVPQSGFTNEALLGSKLLGRIRKQQILLPITPTFFANPGVDPISLVDNATEKSSDPLGTTATVVIADLGSEWAMTAFDVYEFKAATASGNRPLRCETSRDGTNWSTFGAGFGIDSESRTRRFALPPGQSRLVRFVRLVVRGATFAPGVFTLRGVRALGESVAGSYRTRRFTFSRSEYYTLVFSGNNVDVWRNGVWQTAIAITITPAQIAVMDLVQQLDTMFVLHEDFAPLRIMRQGADDEWTCWTAPFRRVPDVDYGGVYFNGVPAVYSVQLVSLTLPASIVLSVSGEDTEAIDIVSDSGITAANIAAQLEALPSIEPGIGVVYNATRDAYDISFTGDGNEGDGWTVTGRMVSPASAAVLVSRRQKGRAGGEPLMSALRGWPSCGAIYQQRLVLGGFRSKPNAWLASASGDYFDLNIEVVADTGAYLGAVDTVGAERIERIVYGTFLQFLSSEREYYLTDLTLTRSKAPNIRLATNNGIKRGVPAVATDTTTLMIHKNGANVVELIYSDAEQNYVGTNISVLSSSLLKDVVDLAFRGAISADDASVLHTVNADGTMRVFVMLKQQDVNAAPGRFETDGLVISCCVGGADEVLIGVDRPVTGGTVQCLEQISSAVPLDCWQQFTLTPPQTIVAGLAEYHEGATVWAIADDIPVGPFVVTGGAITLPEPASQVYVGRWRASEMITLPVPKDVGEKTVVDRPVRVHTVRAFVIDTSSVAIGTETDGPFDIDLINYGDAADRLLLREPVTRAIELEGLAGWSDEGKVIITQLRPGRLTVRGTTIETER